MLTLNCPRWNFNATSVPCTQTAIRDLIVIQDPYRYYKNALIKHSDAAIHRVLVREFTKAGSTGWSKHNATNVTVFIFISSVWQFLAVECTAFMTRGLGPVSRKSHKVFVAGKLEQNLKPF